MEGFHDKQRRYPDHGAQLSKTCHVAVPRSKMMIFQEPREGIEVMVIPTQSPEDYDATLLRWVLFLIRTVVRLGNVVDFRLLIYEAVCS